MFHLNRVARSGCICLMLIGSALLLVSGTRAPALDASGKLLAPRPVTDQQFAEGQALARRLGAVYPQSKNKAHAALVGRVALRLLEAADTPGKQRWNIVIFDTGRVNALAAIGNWFFVWRGVLAFAKTEDELAAILAHEIGHALAGHLQDGGVAFNAYGSTDDDGRVSRLASFILAQLPEGIRTLFATPERHRREFEADQLGLLLMADAGYSPLAAIRVLERYAQAAQQQKLEDSSTPSHPLTADRLTRLNALLPTAMQRYAAKIARADQAALRSAEASAH